MERQKSDNGKNSETLVVSFICPVGKEFEASDILETLGFTAIKPTFQEVERKLVGRGGEVVVQKGFEFKGELDSSDYGNLIKAMAEKKVAGFSRETQILAKIKPS